MRVLDELDDLTHIVQCREVGRHWETIAAFNVGSVADNYAADCDASNRGFKLEYRVRKIRREK